ncbi:peptide ABC transporter substrate-binding protein [Caldanaerobacter subterraneus]|uniref:Oligopeptide transport system substrate-binding protein n=1 Tax=Caldanaerobacter subterraneus TaxID=911092 RepID=A0A4R2JK97_9THEO|nr:peptide ABC transporter substrate-binding protein [Caldanaerobacter subterraneus]TCO60411.1 oligopeptide transport system substrate-binding protein [Caldanaerobacter subterraneus]
MKIKVLAAFVSLLFIISTVLGGCSSQPTKTASSPETEKQILRINLGEEPPRLDPQTSTDGVSFQVLNAVLEGLVRLGPDEKPQKGSGLAKDWKISEDGLTYTFYLKDNIYWSDGNPITAYDFEYSWKRALDPKTASDYAYIMFPIKNAEKFNAGEVSADEVGIKALDEKTLEVQLEEPTPYFLSLTAFITYLPLEKSFVEKVGDKIATTPDTLVYSGPFIIKEWNHEQNIILVKNDKYWDKDNVKLDEIHMDMIKDMNTVVQNFDNGQYDIITVTGDFVERYKNNPNAELQIYPNGFTYFLAFNTKNPVFKNANIRKAFGLSIDRKQLTENVLKDGSIPAYGFVPYGIPGKNEEFRKEVGNLFTEDPVKAKELLQKGMNELGITSLPKITLLADDTEVAKRESQAIQEFWKKNLGVNVEIQNVPFKIRLQMYKQGDFDVVLTRWGADYNDPMTFMDLWLSEISGEPNRIFYSNPEYDKLILEAKKSNDNNLRMDNMKKAEQILMEDMPISPLFFSATAYVQQKYVKGVVRHAVGVDNDWKWTYIEKH